MIEELAQEYLNALKNDSPVVSRSHEVRIYIRQILNDEQYEEFNQRVEELLK